MYPDKEIRVMYFVPEIPQSPKGGHVYKAVPEA